MMYQVLRATLENPSKNDFVTSCQKNLNVLGISLSFLEIENMSQWSFKKLVKEKTALAGFKYLVDEKEKQSKIMNIVYSKLEMQEHFSDGYCNENLSKLIFKARSQTLDKKTQRKWKYADKICIGCRVKEESGDEILICDILNKVNRQENKPIGYDWFYSENVCDIVKVGKIMQNGLK